MLRIMKIVFLGTGAGSTRGSKRFKAGIYVNSGSSSIVLDLGTGANMRLEDFGLFDINAILITHLHLDHFNGVFDHLLQRKLSSLPVVRIYTVKGFSEILERYIRAGNKLEAVIFESDLPKLKLDDLYIYSVPACHSVYGVAYVVQDKDKKVVYSGDTAEPCEEILRESKDANLIIHECSCLEDCKAWGHTSLKDLTQLFPDKRVIITHVPAQIEGEIIEGAKNKFLIANDGLVINV